MVRRGWKAFVCIIMVSVMILSMTGAAAAEQIRAEENAEVVSEENTESMAETEELEDTFSTGWESFRFKNGEPIKLAGEKDLSPTAWKKVNGVYLNDKGIAIPGAIAKGIDVSFWQGDIDWDKVCADGVEFAIIRCGATIRNGSQINDSYWETNASACKARNLPFGAYFYSVAKNEEDAVKEANFVLQKIKNYNLSLPVFYDLEDAAIPTDQLLKITKAFVGTLQNAGVRVGIYANSYWFNTFMTNSYYDTLPRWVAHWASSYTTERPIYMWQCSDQGKVDGIKGYVDLDFRLRFISEERVTAFIERLYEKVLGRKADVMGLDTWLESVAAGQVDAAGLVYGFYYSKEYLAKNVSTEDYVECLYNVCLNRPSDAAGKADWVNYIDNVGISRKAVLSGFIQSNEFKNICMEYGIQSGRITVDEPRDMNYGITRLVSRFYNVFFDRKADVGGLNNWCCAMLNGTMAKNVAHGFVFSKEFMNKNYSNEVFVKYLYKGILGREPDPSGFDHWVQKLNSGKAAREDIFNGFANSIEFRNIVASYGAR